MSIRSKFFAPFTSHGNCTSTSVATTFHWVLLLSPRILRVRPSRPLTLCPPCLAWLAARVKSAPTRPPCLALLTSLLQPPPYDAHNAHPSAPCSLHLTAPGLVTTLQARSKVLCKGCHAYPRHAGSRGGAGLTYASHLVLRPDVEVGRLRPAQGAVVREKSRTTSPWACRPSSPSQANSSRHRRVRGRRSNPLPLALSPALYHILAYTHSFLTDQFVLLLTVQGFSER